MSGESYRLDFILPVLPAMNTAATRAHRMVQYREAKALQQVVGHVAKLRPHRPLARARVTAVRCSARQPDFENMVYSFKPIFDALVNIGVLAGDGPAVCDRVYRWEPAPARKGHVRITVQELKGEQS